MNTLQKVVCFMVVVLMLSILTYAMVKSGKEMTRTID